MRIAVATDQDCVASGFGCCPFWTIVDVDDGRIRQRLLIPNPGASHTFWADLFFRNSVEFVIVGAMGSTARSVMRGMGIQPVLVAKGQVDDVVRRFAAGEMREEGTGSGPESVPTGSCDGRA